jgi:hypothetical protein
MVVEARLGQDHSWHACNPLPRGQQFFMEDTESSCAQICDFVNSVLAGSFYWAFDGLVEARCLDTNRCSRTQLLLACKQILKDDVKREQYDYAVAHPDQVPLLSSIMLTHDPKLSWCLASTRNRLCENR